MRPLSNHLNTSSSSPAAQAQHSPWHSPVPYLFGGLAAMLGLIAFALLILACSYWKLSGYLEDGDGGERDPENSDAKASDSMKMPSSAMEARVVVIMAGDEKPTYLAMPISSKPFSYQEKKDEQEEEHHHHQQLQQQKESQKEREENQEPCNPNP